jgi:hypothetical protein
MERRTFLTAGGTTVLAFATRPPLAAGTPDDPETVVREYYRRATTAETPDAVRVVVRDLSYSASPLHELAETNPFPLDAVRRRRLVSTTVLAKNVGAARIRGISEFLAAYVGDAEIEAVAEENAVVAVTLDTDLPGGTLATEWLVAPENGRWRLVWPDARNSPEAAVRGLFRQVVAAESVAGLADGVAEFSHSASPLPDLAADNPEFLDGTRGQRLLGTSVVAADVGLERIADEFTVFAGWADDSTLETVAEENAVIGLTLTDDDSAAETVVREWLVAPDDGEWRVVWL